MLVAHEPPVIEYLPDRAQLAAGVQDIYDAYQAEGADKAIGKFVAWAASNPAAADPGAPPWEPSAEQVAQMRATFDWWPVLFAHSLLPTELYQPDIAALRAVPTRIVFAAGAESTGQVFNRAAVALAGQLGTRVVEFPGDHSGYRPLPEESARLLDQVLTQSS
jgi:clorobiocin biosynthesis protein CloN7